MNTTEKACQAVRSESAEAQSLQALQLHLAGLDQLLSKVLEYLPQQSQSITPEPPLASGVQVLSAADRHLAEAALNEVCDLLRTRNMRATTAFDDFERRFGATLRADIAPLRRAIEALDFVAAGEAGRALHEQLHD